MNPITDPALLEKLNAGSESKLPAFQRKRTLADPSVAAALENRAKSKEQIQQELESQQSFPGQLLLAGIGKGMVDLGRGVGQRLGMVSQEEIDDAARRDEPLMRTNQGALGNMIGKVATAAPAAFIPGANTVVGSSLIGAGLNALEPTRTGESVGKNALVGAAAGLGGVLLPRAMARVAKPINATPEAERLIAEGVYPTPGQAAGGMWKGIEDKATSIPLIGDAINMGQRKAMEQFNQAALRRSGAPVTKAGSEGVAQAADNLGMRYDQILPQLKLKPTSQLEQDFLDAAVRNDVPPHLMGEVDNFVGKYYTPQFSNTPQGAMMNGQQFREMNTKLRQMGDQFSRSQDPFHQRLGQTFKDMRGATMNAAETQGVNPPGLINDLRGLNSDYANFVPARDAAASAGALNRAGVFTPAQYMSQVSSQAKRAGQQGSLASGNARNQQFATDASQVLGNKYPDSGTAGRVMLDAGALSTLGAIGAGTGSWLPLAATGAGGAATAAAMTNAGRKYMVGGMSPYQKAVANFLRSKQQYGIPLSMGAEEYNEAK